MTLVFVYSDLGEEPASKKIKLAVKGGAAVDPASGITKSSKLNFRFVAGFM